MKDYITNKKETAQISAMLVLFKAMRSQDGYCTTLTPMRDCFNERVKDGTIQDTPEMREKYLRTARYLGWEVRKTKGIIYENGVAVWSTVGR